MFLRPASGERDGRPRVTRREFFNCRFIMRRERRVKKNGEGCCCLFTSPLLSRGSQEQKDLF